MSTVTHTHLDELQFEVLWHRMGLGHTKYISDDVMRGVPFVPEGLQYLVAVVNACVYTVRNHLLDEERVGLIAHLRVILCRK